jgi:hypothetical protein
MLFIFYVSFVSCGYFFDLESYGDAIRENQRVKDIISIKNLWEPLDSQVRLRISLILSNNGGITFETNIQNHQMKKIIIFNIAEYRIVTFGGKLNDNGEWQNTGYSEYLHYKVLETLMHFPVESAHDVINNYDEILKKIIEIYNEPIIPYELTDIEKLRTYKGFVKVNDNVLVKIYVKKNKRLAKVYR